LFWSNSSVTLIGALRLLSGTLAFYRSMMPLDATHVNLGAREQSMLPATSKGQDDEDVSGS
jgi:hypothetical protein